MSIFRTKTEILRDYEVHFDDHSELSITASDATPEEGVLNFTIPKSKGERFNPSVAFVPLSRIRFITSKEHVTPPTS